MRQIGSQISFDPLDYSDGDAKAAVAARNAMLRDLRKSGKTAHGWTLTGQLRKYSSFGVHAKAAIALCRKLGWTGELICGATHAGYVFVFVKDQRYNTTQDLGEQS